MKKLTITLISLAMILAFTGLVMAAGDYWPTSTSKFVSVAGDSVVVFSAKSGLKAVIDSGILVDEDDADSALYVYTEVGSMVSVNSDAVAQTAVTLTNTTSAAIGRTGDIMYELVTADDPSDSTLIFHGVITGITYSDTANTDYLTRAASNSEATLDVGDTVYIARPIVGTRGTGATNILPYTVTDDAAVVYFADQNVAAAYTASGANHLNTSSVFPVGMFGKDYLIRWDTGGAIVDGEIKNLTGHYESKK